MFFILSTGRCGSTTIAKALSSISGISCIHETEPKLIREAHDYLVGTLDMRTLVEILRKTRTPADYKSNYGESNQKLSFMVNALRITFPEADYIWLVRNGLDVVASTYYRGWYLPGECHLHKWSTYRIQADRLGVMSSTEWNALDNFSKNCWYWAWTNQKIEHDLKMTKARYKLVRLEELSSKLPEVASFLGVNLQKSIEVPVMNVAQKGKGKTTKIQYWDSSQRAAFKLWCGPLMDRLYPGWDKHLTLPVRFRVRNELLRPLSSRYAVGRYLESMIRRLPKAFRLPLRSFSEGRRN